MTDDERDSLWNDIPGPPRHWDRLGVPISLREWSDLMEDRDYAVINQTLIAARWLVSTVWLGIDHGFRFLQRGTDMPPLQFETMVFDHGPRDQRTEDGARSDPWRDLEQERYHTEAAAREGHERMVQLVMTLEQTENRIDVK